MPVGPKPRPAKARKNVGFGALPSAREIRESFRRLDESGKVPKDRRMMRRRAKGAA